jgi:polyisoprenoid-binding protein YceI
VTPFAAPSAPRSATLHEGTLSFEGHATTGDFVGTTTSVTGAAAAGPDLATTRGWVEAPVATLHTGNKLRDRDMRSVMEVDKYPSIRYDLTDVTVRSTSADSSDVTLHGTLRLHGVSRSVDVPATVVRDGDVARVVGTFPVNVSDYQVRGLTKVLGMLRMQERIEVHLALRFDVAPHEAAAGSPNPP